VDAGFPIEVAAAEPEHVRILTRDADGFDEMVRELLPPKTAEAALTLKPYLFVEWNLSAQSVVAYCVHYQIAGAIHGAGNIFCHQEDPTAVLTKATGRSTLNDPLRPGDRRVRALSAVFSRRADRDDPYWVPDYRKHQREKYPPESVQHLRISLDAVILEDGSLFGPDESGFAKHFSKYVATEREILRRIVKSADAGKSLNSVIQSLRDESDALRAKPRSFRDDSVFCTVQSTGEAYGLWKRNGDEAFLRLAREMAGGEPFRVRRRNSGA
jgi:hypothetical protein